MTRAPVRHINERTDGDLASHRPGQGDTVTSVGKDPVALFLVSVASIFLIGACGEVVFRRTSIPDVVWLILAGIVIGPVGGIVIREQLGTIAPYFAALTLVVVLFEGGSRLKLADVSLARRARGAATLVNPPDTEIAAAAAPALAPAAALGPQQTVNPAGS